MIDVTQHIQQWVKHNNPPLFADAALDFTRSKAELILENAFLRQQLIVLNRQVKRARRVQKFDPEDVWGNEL